MTDKDAKFAEWQYITEEYYAVAVWENEGGSNGHWFLDHKEYNCEDDARLRIDQAKMYYEQGPYATEDYSVVKVTTTHRVERL